MRGPRWPCLFNICACVFAPSRLCVRTHREATGSPSLSLFNCRFPDSPILGTIPLVVSGVTLVSQAVVSPTVAQQFFSGSPTGKTWSVAGPCGRRRRFGEARWRVPIQRGPDSAAATVAQVFWIANDRHVLSTQYSVRGTQCLCRKYERAGVPPLGGFPAKAGTPARNLHAFSVLNTWH